jgi:hypothetical protein
VSRLLQFSVAGALIAPQFVENHALGARAWAVGACRPFIDQGYNFGTQATGICFLAGLLTIAEQRAGVVTAPRE